MGRIITAVILSLTIGACQANPPAESNNPRAPTDVLVVSKPDAAGVFLGGSLVGKTPMSIKVSEPMKLELRRDGYQSKEIKLGPDTGPNLIVELVPTGPVANDAEVELEVDAGKAVVEPTETEAPPETQKSEISNARAAKTAYRRGNITRTQYNRIIDRLRARLKRQNDRHKIAYRKGHITKDEYNRRVRKSKLAYEGR